MKKIMYLHSGAELYGADQILLTITKRLDRSKFEPIVVLPSEGPLCDKLNENNIKYEIIKYPIIRRKYFNLKGIFQYFLEYRKAIKKLSQFVINQKIDIIHNNTIAVLEGISLKRKLKVKLIFHIHEMLEHPKLVAKVLYKFSLKYSDTVIVVSNAVKQHISSLIKNKKNNIIVVHNGIEPIKIKNNDKLKKELNIPENANVVAIIGRINAIKGQEHFVSAMEKIIKKEKNTYGLIIGDAFIGQEWRIDSLKDYIEKKNLKEKVKYCGFQSHINEFYSIIDCLTLSSIQYDSFPTVVLEAMSCGIPTVAYKCGGVEEMIKSGTNGFLVEQNDIEDLSEKISNVLEKNFDSLKIKKYFQTNFSVEKFISDIEDIYK